MIIAALPENESLRLSDLALYDLQDSSTEADFDQLSELVAQYFKCPLALITVIDSDRQWFKGKKGTTETGNSRSLSFCSHTLLTDDVMVVEDATKDKRFFDSPFVAGDYKIRFYAGAPIVSEDGYKLGTVCIYDMKSRKLNASKRNALLLFARQVTKLLEVRKRNILLRQRAEELIQFKSQIFGRFIQQQEKDKKEIAFHLHENFAQGIAATLMMLQMSIKSKPVRSELVSKAILDLKEILINIRDYSYEITPQIPGWVAADQLITEFVEKIRTTHTFKITLDHNGSLHNNSSDILHCIIRIIDQWLSILQKKKSVNQVAIALTYGEQVILSIMDDGAKENIVERRKDVFDSIVDERARLLGGEVELLYSNDGKYLLRVTLPVAKK